MLENVFETRQIASVLLDEVKCNITTTMDTITDETLETAKADFLLGKKLIVGQIVNLYSYIGDTIIGSNPAIVTNSVRKGPSTIAYTFMPLLGTLSGMVSTIELKNSDLETMVDVTINQTPILDAIKANKLGADNLVKMKEQLGVPHLFVLDKQNEFVNSYF